MEQEDAESNCSSDSLSALSLSYSSSSFEWSGGGIGTPEAHEMTKELGEDTVEPYLYEPEYTGTPSSVEDSSSQNQTSSRLGNTEW